MRTTMIGMRATTWVVLVASGLACKVALAEPASGTTDMTLDEPGLAADAPSRGRYRRIALGTSLGYMGLTTFEDVVHGTEALLSMNISWVRGRVGHGLRIDAEVIPMIGSQDKEIDVAIAFALHVGYLYERGGFWLSPGLGFFGVQVNDDPKEKDEGAFTIILPEVQMAMGYRIPLTSTIDLDLQGQLATPMFVTLRYVACVGLAFKI